MPQIPTHLHPGCSLTSSWEIFMGNLQILSGHIFLSVTASACAVLKSFSHL